MVNISTSSVTAEILSLTFLLWVCVFIIFSIYDWRF